MWKNVSDTLNRQPPCSTVKLLFVVERHLKGPGEPSAQIEPGLRIGRQVCYDTLLLWFEVVVGLTIPQQGALAIQSQGKTSPPLAQVQV
jgi:hypothetical protein